MLRLYRRHRIDCKQTSERFRRCACPIYVEGTLRGEPVRKALDLTSWEAATEVLANWNAAGRIGATKRETPTVAEAVDRYFEDAAARNLRPPSIKKLTALLRKRLLPWCDSQGFRYLRDLDVEQMRRFRATWTDGPVTAQKYIERLRAFFRFCEEADWIGRNPARALKPPRVESGSERVKVFTPDELKKILAACDRYPEYNRYGHDYPERVRAFVLVLRYSGLRIGDCIGLKKEHLAGDRLFLRTQKTGTHVYLPLPPAAVEQLVSVNTTGDYFFWTGNGERDSAVSNWERSLRRVFKLAGLKGNPHMFRHTFATELLGKGVDAEIVAALLGHSSSRITLRYYSHWVKARQVKAEQAVRLLWEGVT